MTYTVPNWQDEPSTATPTNAANLNQYTFAVNDLDSRVTLLNTTVASKVASVTNADSTITMGGTATAPTVKVNAIAESQVTNLTTDLAAKAPLASPSFTGTISSAGRFVETPDAITFTASWTPDASTGNYFRMTLTANLTLNAPTNLTDGQLLTFEFIQDGTGSRTCSYNSIYTFSTTGITAGTLTTTASKRDFITFVYNATTAKLYALQFVKGY
jgi:hypothetical protein